MDTKLSVAALAAALALCACVPQQPPPPAVPADPAQQGHSQWCGTSPPSGYCDVDDHR